MIISHLYKSNVTNQWCIQSNEEHSLGVAKLASQFAGEFGMSSWGEVLGMLHDKGKESYAFQQYIKKTSGYEPDAKVSSEHHHAYVGAILAKKLYGKTSENFFVNQILSHHTGLHDVDELNSERSELSNKIPSEIDVNVEKIKLDPPRFHMEKQDFHHLARMLFSCLVDADYLDTEAFMAPPTSKLRKNKNTIEELLPLLKLKLEEISNVQKITYAEIAQSRAPNEVIPFRKFIVKNDTSALL